MAKFTHYLVTRFNVPAGKWLQDKEGRPTLDDAWMDHRFELFRKYCVPTVTGQTEKNFRWIIYCGAGTKAPNLNLIRDGIQHVSNAEIRLVDHMGALNEDLKKMMSEADTPFVISSRLDNDDGLGKNYIRAVQENFRETDLCLLNFCDGVFYDIHEKIMTRQHASFLNHYGSLIELKKEPDALMTVLGFHHTAPAAEVTIVNLKNRAAWLKIIHDRNARSRMKGWVSFSKNVLEYFQTSKELFSISMLNSGFYLVSRLKLKIGTLLTNK